MAKDQKDDTVDDEVIDKEKEETDEDIDDDNIDDDADEDTDENDDDSDDDDDKPITGKDLRKMQDGILKTINERFTARRHAQKDAKNYKRPNRDTGKEKDETTVRLDRIEVSEKKRQFGYANNLAPDEVDMIFKYNKNPSPKTLKDPFIQGGLERMRANKNAKGNIPGGNHSTAKYTVEGKDWGKLSPTEKQQNFKARQDEILARQGRR